MWYQSWKLKAELSPKNGVKYYPYLLCYVDDILYIHDYADAMLGWLNKPFLLKSGYGKSDMYLGVKLCITRVMGYESC